MNHRYNAIKKCTRNHKREWCGYLIPKEILALKDLGVAIKIFDAEIAIDWKRRGVNNGRWIYFQANDEFEEIRRGQRMLGDQSNDH